MTCFKLTVYGENKSQILKKIYIIQFAAQLASECWVSIVLFPTALKDSTGLKSPQKLEEVQPAGKALQVSDLVFGL